MRFLFEAAFAVRRSRFSDDLAEAIDAWHESDAAGQSSGAQGQARHRGALAVSAADTMERLARMLVAEVGLASPDLPATLSGRVDLPRYSASLELRLYDD